MRNELSLCLRLCLVPSRLMKQLCMRSQKRTKIVDLVETLPKPSISSNSSILNFYVSLVHKFNPSHSHEGLGGTKGISHVT